MQFEGIVERFPNLCVAEGIVKDLEIGPASDDLEKLKPEIAGKIRSAYTLEAVKDDPGFRAYRDFFWSVGVDPTKTRPASEALVRRILAGKPLPTINTAVDAYNLVSALHGVPIAAFDADLLSGSLTMRFATAGEQFKGIGMKEPVDLKPNQVIICDEAEIIAIYPYRDSDSTKVTMTTKNMHIISCGVPGVSRDRVLDAYRACGDYLAKYCHGSATEPHLYP
ncbi:B3/B4 domain-containing protein [Methanocella arvoryzae]|uniref:B3/B4 tRNA-binding domain-containing protein n=1 Tax=Methanocella arvoryzae (strain DSM 22066 / NBRC 105507 / MRE50) TaxID=351160 RepID=Q0W1T9_METAR|nr:phenylalanine--tRNA ligase beta subunit-related protein [Methanocella arvoryzae]CAJ37654.1 conserved hypothetical protein [Methanocella arvoryzae MRE50]